MKDFTKHDGSSECPVPFDTMVHVETWTPHDKPRRAGDINWRFVKWYKIVQREDIVNDFPSSKSIAKAVRDSYNGEE